ncbi:MAG: MerR family transcriptional regulator [Ruminococcus flavefaciens]|nr:MerR family transcriptional regulator [Ruminococcus flavefaciens]
MDMPKLFSIGDVAKLFHISVSSLRHYEDMGLLTPEHIDSDSGYRYYSTRQFEVLNTIRYLRALDLPLSEIADFLGNRDVERIEEKLRQQKETVIAKQAELKRIERKIDNRLRMIADAKNSEFDSLKLIHKEPCRIVWVRDSLKIHSFLDMETPIRKLEETQAEALVFLGKVGVGISEERLRESCFDSYDGIFLILDEEDHFNGKPMTLPETLCVSVRFHGSHAEAPEQYRKLINYIAEHKLEISGFSREITMIDYGITNDTEKFVTEISIPVICT